MGYPTQGSASMCMGLARWRLNEASGNVDSKEWGFILPDIPFFTKAARNLGFYVKSPSLNILTTIYL